MAPRVLGKSFAAPGDVHAVLEQDFRGHNMAKAGVMLLDLMPGNVLQDELALEEEDQRDRTKSMVALDTLNQRYGKGTVHSGATGGTNKGKDWGMKQERRTPQYTTRWEDVPVARA